MKVVQRSVTAVWGFLVTVVWGSTPEPARQRAASTTSTMGGGL